MKQSVSKTPQDRNTNMSSACTLTDKCRLKVLFISDATASRNGVGSYYADLVDHLTHFIEHAELISPGIAPENYTHKQSLALPGDPTQRLHLPKVIQIYKKIKAVKPDTIVTPTPGPYGLIGLVIARCLAIPLCSGYHTQYDKLTTMYWASALTGLYRSGMKLLNRVFFGFSEVVVGNSKEMTDGAMADGAKSAVIIGTPINRSFLSPPIAPISSELSSVFFAGRLALEKNITDVLEAAKKLPHIRFVIAGDGPLETEVVAMAKSAANIEYVGWVSRREVKEYIDAAGMLILPSKVEAFGTIALEAMARRRLVLVSERCGILAWPDLAAGIYRIGKNESLADAIDRISKRRLSERAEKAKRAHQAAVCFNRHALCHWVGLLSSVANSGRKHKGL